MKKKIIIVGGTGFLGFHLATYCLKKNWKVLSISRNNPKKIRFFVPRPPSKKEGQHPHTITTLPWSRGTGAWGRCRVVGGQCRGSARQTRLKIRRGKCVHCRRRPRI